MFNSVKHDFNSLVCQKPSSLITDTGNDIISIKRKKKTESDTLIFHVHFQGGGREHGHNHKNPTHSQCLCNDI